MSLNGKNIFAHASICDGCKNLTLNEALLTQKETGMRRCEKCVASGNFCACPTICDCQNPPPEDWDGKSGVFHVSNYCPEHNFIEEPANYCPIHGSDEVSCNELRNLFLKSY